MLDESCPVPLRLSSVASRRHGIVDKGDLAEIGVPASTVAHWARTGRLHRLYPGVFSVVPPALLAIEGHWLAAVRACGQGAALSHRSAAQLHWLIDRRERLPIHVSVAGRAGRRPRGIVVHRPRTFPAGDLTVRASIAVTTVTRTVWDSASCLSPRIAARAYERAAGADRLDRVRIRRLLAAVPNHPGSAVLRRLERTRALPLGEVRSWLEELLLLVCAEHGLPIPGVNVPLLGYEADFHWERERLVVEADGGEHLNQAQRTRDNERDAAFGRAGLLVRRYTSDAMARGDEVAAEVAEILAERSARGSPGRIRPTSWTNPAR